MEILERGKLPEEKQAAGRKIHAHGYTFKLGKILKKKVKVNH